jgi:transcriptional regulator
MYIPNHFKIENKELILEFIQHHSFGILISVQNNIPVLTHLPFYYDQTKPELTLLTHLAAANPHCEILNNDENCLVVFNGPHGYISPSLYKDAQNVPTWNYMTVHAHCEGKILKNEADKIEVLKKSIQVSDPDYIKQFNQLKPEYLNAMYPHLSALELKVNKLECKFKLSQNKPKEDILSVSKYFEENNQTELAHYIRKINQL